MLNLRPIDVLQCFCGLCGAFVFFKLVFRQYLDKRLPLPPGPKPLPLLGNLFDMPKKHEHAGPFWAKHKALYGPISSVTILGTVMIIINDVNIALELLDKRSSKYSSRPSITFGGEMVGFKVATGILPYGDTWKLHRKVQRAFIGSRQLNRYEHTEELEARRFLLLLLNKPKDFREHIRLLPGAVIVKISHGYTINPSGSDPLIELADNLMTIFSESCEPGRWLVDVIPSLKHVPSWFPGMTFKKTGEIWAQVVDEFFDKPYKFVKHQMAKGKAIPSLVSESIEDSFREEHDEHLLKHLAGSLYAGGADTSVSALATFFLAMSLYPDAFKRMQEEIDSVVGIERLPSFADRPRLQYIEAIVKETLRWQNVSQAGIPHVTTEDDTYNGYHIPKGAIVVPVIWQFTHDPEIYSDPFDFKPERFLGEEQELDPRSLVFGFGRRICPGLELAVNTLFIAIAMVAATFDVGKEKDDFGTELDPDINYTPGIVSHPKEFKCSITPRSQNAINLIKSVLDESLFDNDDSNVFNAL